MSSPIHIEREESGRRGRYVARVDGHEGEAELIFTRRGPHLTSADHTEAPDSLRGTGVALALVERMIADARTEGFKIIPLCPYVLAQSKKHAEWSDVIAPAPSAS